MNATLVEFLQCPVTHSKLRLDGEYLVSEIGGLKYPIIDGFPTLLPDQAILPPGVATLEEFRSKCPNLPNGSR